jgi:hypothetical protein
MNFSNNDVASRELCAGELEAVSAGLHLSFGPNPPRGGEYGGGCRGELHHGDPTQGGPAREFAGGVPNDPALRPRYF